MRYPCHSNFSEQAQLKAAFDSIRSLERPATDAVSLPFLYWSQPRLFPAGLELRKNLAGDVFDRRLGVSECQQHHAAGAARDDETDEPDTFVRPLRSPFDQDLPIVAATTVRARESPSGMAHLSGSVVFSPRVDQAEAGSGERQKQGLMRSRIFRYSLPAAHPGGDEVPGIGAVGL